MLHQCRYHWVWASQTMEPTGHEILRKSDNIRQDKVGKGRTLNWKQKMKFIIWEKNKCRAWVNWNEGISRLLISRIYGPFLPSKSPVSATTVVRSFNWSNWLAIFGFFDANSLIFWFISTRPNYFTTSNVSETLDVLTSPKLPHACAANVFSM